MPRRPSDISYAVDDMPPWYKLIPLSIQYALLMMVYLVIIVIVARAAGVSDFVANSAVRVGLIALAISTILQAVRFGPIGSGFLAAPVISAIYLDPSLIAAKQGGLGLVFGMTMYAGVIEIIFSRVLHQLRAFFPPGICGFVVLIVGLQLGLVGIEQVLDVTKFQSANFHLHVLTALLTLAVIVATSIWWKGTVRLMCSFIGIVIGFITALVLGLVPVQHIHEIAKIPLFALPFGYHFTPKFDLSLIVPFTVAGIAASLRTVGVITTSQKINDADWKHPDLKSIQGGIFADGIGCFLSGLMGSLGMNTAPSLVGVAKATGATSRYIGYGAAAILITLAFLPKLTAVMLILPKAVIGAALVFTGSFMIIGGIQVIVSRNIDSRMTYVVGISLLLGVSRDLFANFYNSLPGILHAFTASGLTLAISAAIILNLIFRIGIKQKASVSYHEADISVSNISEFFAERSEEWVLDQALTHRAVATTSEVMKHIRDTHIAESDVRISLTYDQVDLVVQIDYEGQLLMMPFVGQQRKVFLEEESFSYGLADFWNGVFPDKLEYSTKGKHIELKLYFSA